MAAALAIFKAMGPSQHCIQQWIKVYVFRHEHMQLLVQLRLMEFFKSVDDVDYFVYLLTYTVVYWMGRKIVLD